MVRTPRPPFRPPLRPTAALTLLAIVLAVSAALVAQRVQRDAERVLETRGRLVLTLAAHTELRLERLRSALTAVAGPLVPGEIPDAARLAQLLDDLKQRDPGFVRLEVVDDTGGVLDTAPSGEDGQGGAMHGAFPWLADAARAQTLAGSVYPGQDGTARVLLSWRLTPDGRGTHLRAEADPRALPAAMPQGAGVALYYAADGGAVFAPSPDADPAPESGVRQALESLAQAARRSDALTQREIEWPGGGQRIAVAAPLRGDPLSLVLVVPIPAPDDSSRTLPAAFLALGGVILVLLPLLRKARRRP